MLGFAAIGQLALGQATKAGARGTVSIALFNGGFDASNAFVGTGGSITVSFTGKTALEEQAWLASVTHIVPYIYFSNFTGNVNTTLRISLPRLEITDQYATGTGDQVVGFGTIPLTAAVLFAGAGATNLQAGLRLPVAASVIAGVAALSATGRLRLPDGYVQAAVGAFTADTPALWLSATSLIFGDSALVADATTTTSIQSWDGAALIAGAGSIGFDSGVLMLAAAALAGAAAVRSDSGVRFQGAWAQVGAGALAANAQTRLAAAIVLAGTGAAAFDLRAVMQPVCRIAGAGALAVDLVQSGQQAGAALLAGVGAVATVTQQTMMVQTILAGTAALKSDSAVLFQVACTRAGAGALASTGSLLMPAGWAQAGVGSSAVLGVHSQLAQTLLAGSGVVTSASVQRMMAQMALPGAAAYGFNAFAVQGQAPRYADYAADNGLAVLDVVADQILLCTQMPLTYAEALTYALGGKNFGAAGGAVGAVQPAVSGNGRRVVTTPVTDGSITTTGTVQNWALIDSANSRLLVTGKLTSPFSVNSGDVFSLPSFNITIPGH